MLFFPRTPSGPVSTGPSQMITGLRRRVVDQGAPGTWGTVSTPEVDENSSRCVQCECLTWPNTNSFRYIFLWIHSLNKHVLSIDHMPSTVWGAQDVKIFKAHTHTHTHTHTRTHSSCPLTPVQSNGVWIKTDVNKLGLRLQKLNMLKVYFPPVFAGWEGACGGAEGSAHTTTRAPRLTDAGHLDTFLVTQQSWRGLGGFTRTRTLNCLSLEWPAPLLKQPIGQRSSHSPALLQKARKWEGRRGHSVSHK